MFESKTMYKIVYIKENPPQKREEDLNQLFSYKDIYNRDKNPEWARKMIYRYAQTHSIKETAKEFSCGISTVKKIKGRGKNGEFASRSNAPMNSPNRISEEMVEHILECREEKGMGPLNLKHQYDIPVSVSTIYRTLQRKDKIEPRKKKWRETKDLREIKSNYKAFENVQVDGKVLYDIKAFYPYYLHCLVPRIQFTFTCQKTGASFISYADGETMLAGCTFIAYIFEHLKKYGIDVKKIKLKTDWGSYAIGSARTFKKSAFTLLIQETYKAKHRLIKHKNQNADVERFHGLIEQYFYKRTKPNNQADFFKKAYEHIIWHNTIRKNGSKNWKTPLEILKQDYPNIDPQVLVLPPIYLNKHIDLYYYKIGVHSGDLTREDFFRDFNPKFFTWIASDQYQDDCQYYFGNANMSCYLNKSKTKGVVSHGK